MQEQNFEKQVREKMDELSFVPSAPVWGKVEEQIRKKKEKRRVIFWLLPLLITTGIGWWLASGVDTSTPIINNHIPATTRSGAQQQIHPEAVHPNTGAPGNTNELTQEEVPLTSQNGSTLLYPVPSEKRTKANTTLSLYTNKTEVPNEIPFNGRTIDNETKNGHDIAFPQFVIIQSVLNKDSILISKSLINKNIPEIQNRPEEAAKKEDQSKWQFAISIKAGTSGISDGFGNLGRAAEMYYDATPNAPAMGGGGSGNVSAPTPSKPKAEFAYSAGFDIIRKLNKRLAITSGLHYAYYSTSLQVGSYIYRDTSMQRFNSTALQTSTFYRNDANQRKYTNKYHIIQIPLAIEYKLGAQTPLYIQTGFRIEQLLQSNALFYKENTATSSGVYIRDEDMVVKRGLHLFSGISYHFRSKRAFSFAVGPQIQYGLNSFSKNKSNDQRLYFAGISTQFFLKK